MSAASGVVDRLIEETARAVAFGHSHVVVLTEAPFAAELPGRLAAHLRDVMPSFVLGFDPADDGDRLVEQVEATIRGAAGAGVRPELSRTARDELPRAAILVPDALDVPAEVLRQVYARVEARGAGARLVLLVDRDACAVADPTARLAERLGAGIAKVENEARSATPLPGDGPPPGPPRIVHERTGRTRPMRVRGGRSRQGVAPAIVVTLLAAALVTGWLVAPFLVRSVPLTGAAPVASAPAAAAPSDAEPAPRGARYEAPVPEPATIGMPPARQLPIAPPTATAPQASPEASPIRPPTVAAPPPGKPVSEPSARIAVDFNAVPWAELEVDGRSIGPTPVGRVPLAPGPHQVRARFPDGRVVEREIEVDALRNHFRFD